MTAGSGAAATADARIPTVAMMEMSFMMIERCKEVLGLAVS